MPGLGWGNPLGSHRQRMGGGLGNLGRRAQRPSRIQVRDRGNIGPAHDRMPSPRPTRDRAVTGAHQGVATRSRAPARGWRRRRHRQNRRTIRMIPARGQPSGREPRDEGAERRAADNRTRSEEGHQRRRQHAGPKPHGATHHTDLLIPAPRHQCGSPLRTSSDTPAARMSASTSAQRRSTQSRRTGSRGASPPAAATTPTPGSCVVASR